MKPNDKGWFKSYLLSRSESILSDYQQEQLDADRERNIYRWIQPSGLMYGHPVSVPFQDAESIRKYNDDEKLKLLMAESFLMSMYATEKDKENLQQQLLNAPGKVIQFYESLFPDLNVSSRTFFGKEKADHDQAEALIDKRLKVSGSLRRNFWSSFFTNSLLFLDVYFFFQYLETHASIDSQDLRGQLNHIRMIIVKVIAAAAHANDKIEKEEREIFNFFLTSAKLPADKKSEARSFFEKGAPLDELKLPEMQSWLLRKYVLELAVLTLFSDRIMEDREKKFVLKLANMLSLDPEDRDSSIIAIESFVLQNWDNIHFLQGRAQYQIVSERLLGTVRSMLEQNKNSLAKEFRESKELMQLLSKYKKEGLTEQEKEKARNQIYDILKTIPAFVLIALPGSFITFPILLKVLPKNVLPSAFSEAE